MNLLRPFDPPLRAVAARLKATLAATFLLCTAASAQVSTAVDNLIPPSPEASALGKYVQIPVGLYTGTPEISLPLWDLREGDLTLPLSLSYHASGHRTDEIAARTGMGWTLNAGGIITRTIMGEADEYGAGGFLRFSMGNTPASVFTGTEQQKYDRYNQLMDCSDAEPDQFSFNFAGYSGKFVFDWNRNIAVSSERNVLIEPVNLNPGSGTFISAWKVTGEDGTVYLFEAKETSQMTVSGINPCPYTTPPVTSWYLTKITAPSGDYITLNYQPYNEEYRIRLSETTNHRYGSAAATTQFRSELMKVDGQYLSSITTSSGNTTIQFVNGTTVRTDLPRRNDGSTNNMYPLAEIIVLNRDNTELKHFVQEYDYSTGRLTLKSLKEVPASGTVSKPPYRFTYNGALPPFGTGPVGFFQQDHWGYTNANTKSQLTPTYRVKVNGNMVVFDGADREPSLQGSMAGILTQIKYPAGGTTTFEYELHNYSFIANTVLTENATLHKSANVTQSGSESGDSYESRRKKAAFTVHPIPGRPQDLVWVRFYVSLSYCSSTGLGGGVLGPGARILDAAGNPVRVWTPAPNDVNFSQQDSISLLPGDYFIEASAGNRPCSYPGTSVQGWDNAYIAVNWEDYTGVVMRKNKPAGGLRIKKITDADGISPASNIVRRFDYQMSEGDIKVSSGVVTEEPKYEFNTYMVEQAQAVPYVSRISNSVIALGDTRGSHIGYRQVNVLYGENGEEGKSESLFTCFNDINDAISYQPPFQPVTSYDYRRGLLKQTTDYKYENGIFTPVRQTVNQYDFNDANADATSVFALKVGEFVAGARVSGFAYNRAEDVFALGGYNINLGIARLKSVSETVFEGGQSFTRQQSFAYDPKLQFLQKETVKKSDGKELVTEYYYPFNYASPNAAITALKNRHMLSPVVEKLVKERLGDGSERLTGADFTEFNLFGNKVLPVRILRFAATAPVTDFQLSKDHAGSPDTRYYQEASVYNRYSSLGRPEQVTGAGDAVTSYIWGYNGSFPVAEISNSVFARCAYTGFESSEQGNWIYTDAAANYSTDARTGKHCFSGQVSSAQLPGGQYVVSVWARGNTGSTLSVNGITKTIDGNWKLYEWQVSDPGSITVNASGSWIDDLRLHPLEAQMKTFTYQPQLGFSTSADARNNILYYDYDALGRLKNIKDNEGNILKNYHYQYAGK